jgi:hypothetical protein
MKVQKIVLSLVRTAAAHTKGGGMPGSTRLRLAAIAFRGMEEPALCQPPQSPLLILTSRLNIEIGIKLPTIGKGCQEISNDAASQIEQYGLARSAGQSRAGGAKPTANDVSFCS